jgi:hypothetical protein
MQQITVARALASDLARHGVPSRQWGHHLSTIHGRVSGMMRGTQRPFQVPKYATSIWLIWYTSS